VKEMSNKPLSTSMNTVRNGSELDSNDFPERKAERSEPKVRSQSIKSVKPSNIGASNVPNTSKIVAITGDELANMKFDTLNFTGKFLELIGKPEKRFSGIIWGLPKGGKSNLSIRFADYLQEYFGNVLYVAAEEGKSVSMQDKIKSIGGSKLNIIQTRNRDEIKEYIKSSSYDFVFIDSINVAGIDNEFLESIKQENPNKSFVAIVQATKGGNFKGDQSLEHNCDFVIKVVNGVAYHKGRFGPESELNIFAEDLYKKNETRRIVEHKVNPTLKEEPKVQKTIIPDSVKEYIKDYLPKPNGQFLTTIHASQSIIPTYSSVPIQQGKNNLLKTVALIYGGVYLGKFLFGRDNDDEL
jgi:hypothetical protein